MTEPITHPNSTPLLRAAIWVAIGALIAAALVCVVWVLIGTGDGIVARAFLTILLLASFAGIAILEAHLAPRRPAWFALSSMVTWVIALLIGAVMIWMPRPDDAFGWGLGRFVQFLLIVLILQLALLHVRLFTKAYDRYPTTFTTVILYVTIALVVIVAAMLILALLLFDYAYFLPIYWRVVVALAILAAVGTALIPLVNVIFAPRRSATSRPRHSPAAERASTPALIPWPRYADGVTPLPVLPDGSPDWTAYYTGHPTYPQAYSLQASAPQPTSPHPAPQASQAPAPASPAAPVVPTGYQGYPPPPPAPR